MYVFLNKNKTKDFYLILTHMHYKWESSIRVMKTSQRPVHTYNDNISIQTKRTVKLLLEFKKKKWYALGAVISPAALKQMCSFAYFYEFGVPYT